MGSEDNGYIQVNAKKGVVLACGGYANDPELLQKLDPAGQETVVLDTSQAGDTGDAIKAGIWAGGFKDAVASAMVFDRAIGNPGIKGGYPYEGSGFFDGTSAVSPSFVLPITASASATRQLPTTSPSILPG